METPTTGWVDDVSTGYALEFLARAKDKPWAMAVCFKTPHGPFEPPKRWADKFPEGFARPVPNLGVAPPLPWPRLPLPEAGADKLKANLNYFRCLGAMDENVGYVRLPAKTIVAGGWTTLQACYDTETASLLIDGRLAVQSPLKADLRRQPNDGLQIGADLGSQVLDSALSKFQGLVEFVRIYSGKE